MDNRSRLARAGVAADCWGVLCRLPLEQLEQARGLLEDLAREGEAAAAVLPPVVDLDAERSRRRGGSRS